MLDLTRIHDCHSIFVLTQQQQEVVFTVQLMSRKIEKEAYEMNLKSYLVDL